MRQNDTALLVLCLFPFEESMLRTNTRFFFYALNGQLEDHEEIFTEFDDKVFWDRIADHSKTSYNIHNY